MRRGCTFVLSVFFVRRRDLLFYHKCLALILTLWIIHLLKRRLCAFTSVMHIVFNCYAISSIASVIRSATDRVNSALSFCWRNVTRLSSVRVTHAKNVDPPCLSKWRLHECALKAKWLACRFRERESLEADKLRQLEKERECVECKRSRGFFINLVNLIN